MAWYINANGKTHGPVDDAQVLAWIRSQQLLHASICFVGSQQWVDLASYAPFADALREAAPPPPPVGVIAQAQPTARSVATRKLNDPRVKLAVWVLVLVVVSFASAAMGLALSAAMLAHAEFARRRNRPSFVSWVLGRTPSLRQALASLVLGTVMFIGGSGRAIAGWLDYLSMERAARAKEADKAKRQADLLASVPTRVVGWRARLSQVRTAAETTNYFEGGLTTVDGVTADATAVTAQLGSSTPRDVAQILVDASVVRAKYVARSEFAGAVLDFGQQVQSAKDQATAKQWLAADQACATALQDLDTLAKATPSLIQFLPAGFDPAAKQKEVVALRAQFAGPVAVARKQVEHQARLARIATIKSSLDPNDRTSYVSARSALAEEAKACGGCRAQGNIASAMSDVESTLKDWPIDIATVQELKNRYADLKGRRVRLKGALTASTYYNCAYASQGDYRSMEFSGGLFGSQFHVYCSRGDAGCESIFQRLAGGGSENGTAIVKYPTWNDVCEADQAFLTGWSAN
jgi:hypothetical protein